MKVKIQKGVAQGYVNAPPSKSMAHRMLICAGLSNGTCRVKGIAESKDILATIDCLTALGAKCQKRGEDIVVTGIDVTKTKASDVLVCRESGSTLRFFIPICLVSNSETTLTGSKRLMERPLNVYEDIAKEKGMVFVRKDGNVTVKGPLEPGNYRMAGNISSQFISGLLFALPLLEGDSKIEITSPVESRSYINMTIAALDAFGVDVCWQDENTLLIPGKQKYSAEEVYVEGDYSNAAFFEALNAFGGNVEIGNLNEDSIQGDRVYAGMFNRLMEEKAELDISDCPDLGPVLFAVSGAQKGGIFKGTERLKIKESDRAAVMSKELAKFGVEVIVLENEVVVNSKGLSKPETNLCGHNDHRIVMSMAVLSTITGGTIEGAEAVTKSFPDFFEKLQSLGIEVEIIED